MKKSQVLLQMETWKKAMGTYYPLQWDPSRLCCLDEETGIESSSTQPVPLRIVSWAHQSEFAVAST